jgi:hypothetical protein
MTFFRRQKSKGDRRHEKKANTLPPTPSTHKKAFVIIFEHIIYLQRMEL